MPMAALPFFTVDDLAPSPLAGLGSVVGVLLNHPEALAALGEQVHAAPYNAPPRAPVLYLKPRNTWAVDGQAVALPAGAEVEVGASLGIVIGRTASRVTEAQALAHVAGYTVVADLSLPHASFHRPALAARCRDGFCTIGPRLVARERVADPDALAVEVALDGRIVQRGSTAGRIRPVARLIADVSEFMSLHPGDLLLLGPAPDAPRARAGQRVRVTIGGLGTLETPLVAGEDAR